MITRRGWLGLALTTTLLVACHREREAPAEAKPNASGPPQRIASQTVLSDEILWAMGEDVRERVVAVSYMVDDPRYSPVADTWPRSVPRVESEAEAVLAVGPDVAIVASFTAPETKSMLERAGVRLITLDGFDGFDAYRSTIATIGDAIGAKSEAIELRERFDAEIAAIEAQRTTSRPAVISWNDGTIAGRGTTFDDAAHTAGFTNFAADHGIEGHSTVDLETLVSWDPEYLVIPCGELDCTEAELRFAERPGVAKMRAVTAGHVIGIDPAILYSAGQTMVDLARALQERKEDAG